MGFIIVEIKRIYSYRELVWKLSVNQIKAKYRYPILGLLWLILMPVLLSLVFLFAFSIMMKVKVPEYPFLIYLLTAMLPWTYFSSSVMQATNSLVESVNLVKNVSFPREIIPLSVIVGNLINFMFSLPVLFLFFLIFRVKISGYIILFPFIVALHTLLIIGFSLMCAAVQVRLRDTRYIVEIFITAIFYLTPVFYSLDLIQNISPRALGFYMLNPLASITILYRISLLGGFSKYLPAEANIFTLFILPFFFSLFLFYLGFYIFRKLESSFAELI